MSYQLKAHTRSNSMEFLDYILNLFETETMNIRRAFQAPDNDITTLIEFLGTSIEDLYDLEYEDDEQKKKNFTKKELRLLKHIHAWILWEQQNRPGINFTTLKLDDYDQYMLQRNNTSPLVAPTLVTPSATPLQIQIPPPSPAMSQFISPATFVPRVKLDVKAYPTFNGESNNWTKFKHGVLAIASTHGLDEVFEESTIVPQ